MVEPDFSLLRQELESARSKALIAGGAVALMLVANAAVFGGAGYVIAFAPVYWLGRNFLRARQLRALLEKHRQL